MHAHEACASVQEDGFVVLCNLSGVGTRQWAQMHGSLPPPLRRPTPTPLAIRSQLFAPPPPQGVGYNADRYASLLESAGAIEAIVAGLRAHASSAEVQERGIGALCNLALASGGGEVRIRRMAEAGVVEIVEKGLAAHTSCVELCASGQTTLEILCFREPPIVEQ